MGRIAYTNVRYLHPAKGPDRYCGYSLHAPSIRGGGEKDEAKKYGEFLSDRNLLVHHGGVYTFKYAGQKFPKKDLKRTVHWQSLTVRQANISTWVKLLDDICEKASLATQKALAEFVKTIASVMPSTHRGPTPCAFQNQVFLEDSERFVAVVRINRLQVWPWKHSLVL